MTETQCLIIGSGPAGYTAAIYASRANLHPILYSGLQQGGQLTQTTEVENFPGYPNGVDGNQMMEDMRQQALRFGTDMRTGSVCKFSIDNGDFKIITDSNEEISAKTVIIATGATAKYLGLADEEKYRGLGVSACATCDGFFYRKKTVAVVGGGDTACEDALYLAGLAKKVYMIVRKPFLRASNIMQQRVTETENIEILYERRAVGLFGTDGIEGVRLESTNPASHITDEEKEIAIDGFFLAIGHKPNSDVFAEYIDTDENRFIKVDDRQNALHDAKPIPGLFAAGDVCDPVFRQAIVAAASGCKAAMSAERYLQSIK